MLSVFLLLFPRSINAIAVGHYDTLTAKVYRTIVLTSNAHFFGQNVRVFILFLRSDVVFKKDFFRIFFIFFLFIAMSFYRSIRRITSPYLNRVHWRGIYLSDTIAMYPTRDRRSHDNAGWHFLPNISIGFVRSLFELLVLFNIVYIGKSTILELYCYS